MTNLTSYRNGNFEILLIEDSPEDVRLIKEAFKDAETRSNFTVAVDGVEALAILTKQEPFSEAPRPHLILLDLNLPRKDGREVLAEVKSNDTLKQIPVIVFTTSRADEDIAKSYKLSANCYISKPVDFDQFVKVIKRIHSFWLETVVLPPHYP